MAIQYSNNRIAKNTVFMYLRLFVTLVISLYTSRVVLAVLGVSDYGLYHVVGGVLAMFTFISGSLGAATSRFLNVEMGKPDGDVNKIFNINVILHVGLALLILLLAETVGLWYVFNKLNVADGKLGDAVFVYQVSILTACVGIINTPYSSVFSAHEKFGFLTWLDIFNNVLRLGFVIFMQYYSGNVLRYYSLIMCVTTASSFIIYHVFAYKWWSSTVKLRFYNNSRLIYKDVLSYGGWNLMDTISMMVRNSGSDLIINKFFGTILNGAFSVSKQISTQVVNFSSIISGTSAPQITQSYAAGDMKRCNYLVNKMGRFNLLLIELIIFPLFIELDLLLHLWLKEVPENVLLFSQLNLVSAFIAVSCGGISNLIAASGKIKWFKILNSVMILGCLPIIFVLFRMDYPAFWMMIIFMLADALQRVIQLVLLKKLLSFDSLMYIKEAYAQPFMIAIIMSGLVYSYSLLSIESIVLRLLAIVLCGIITVSLVFVIGMTNGERKHVLQYISNKINKNKRNE